MRLAGQRVTLQLGASTGFGALVGALAAGSFTQLFEEELFSLSPYCLLAGFSRVTDFTVAVLIQILVGFFYIASFTTLQVVVQEVVTENFRGRVMSLFNIAWAGLVPIGSLLMGLLASDTGFGLGSADTIGLTSLICVGYVISTVISDAIKLLIAAVIPIRDRAVIFGAGAAFPLCNESSILLSGSETFI